MDFAMNYSVYGILSDAKITKRKTNLSEWEGHSFEY